MRQNKRLHLKGGIAATTGGLHIVARWSQAIVRERFRERNEHGHFHFSPFWSQK